MPDSPVYEWIWDPRKDEANRRKHGLSLADGIPAITDPLAMSRPDPHPDSDRWQLIGSAAGLVTLFVVHTEPVQTTDGRLQLRIISVRRATARERKAYEEAEI